jgi:outer membrane usher protein
VRWTAGDLAALSDELGQGALLAGVSVSTQARLDPYRIRYPLGSVQGQAFLPSEVEVYVDGQRVRTERVPAGVFEIRDLATPLGARSVQLLVRDPYGRVQRYDQALYASQRLLAPGLHDFQYALGGLRRDPGTGSPRYGPAAFSARHAWGAGPGLTLGLRAEAREGQWTGGTAMIQRVAHKGLLSANLAASRTGGLRGHAVLVRHDYQSARWGLGLGVRADSPGYAALGNTQVLGGLRREVQAYASHTLGEGRSVWVGHSRQSLHPATRITAPPGWQLVQGSPRHGTSVGYTAWLRPGASLRLAASRSTQGATTRHAWSVSLVFLLDRGGLLSAQSHHGSDGPGQSIQWSQPAPLQGGWGHDLRASRSITPEGDAVQWRMASHLEANAIRLRADWSGESGRAPGTLRLSAAGALSSLGGRWHHSRPIQDGWALVQVDGLAGVPVTVNGLPAGVTDARGQRLVTSVGAHHETVFEIDPNAVPIDHKLVQVQQRVMLPERGGAVIRFEARPLRALTAQLVTRSGHGPRPLSLARIRVGEGAHALETITGLQGELYLEDLAPGLHEGQALGESGPCRFEVAVPHAREVLTELGMLDCTPPPPIQNRSDGPR